MAKMKMGKASYGGSKKKYFKLKDGEASFRILPPLGELAEEGKWSLFYKVHYGYTNPEGKSRPFLSSLVYNRNTKMVDVPDAALERIETLKGKLEAAKKAGDKKTQEAILKFVGGAKSKYNCDSNHYMNAIDQDGNIGVLKIRHRAKLALDATIKKLRDKGIDPLSVDNGRFFTFTRSGNALETTFQVEVTKRTIQVDGVGEVQQEIIHKLTEEIIDRLSSEAAELKKIFRAPTDTEVAQIVSESDLKTGVSPNIDDILGYKKDASGKSEDDGLGDEGPGDEETPAVEAATTTVVETKQEAVAAAPKQEAAPVTKKETLAVKETVKSAPVAEPKTTTASKVADMDEDEFLASLGIDS